MNIVVCVRWLTSPDSPIRVEDGSIKDRGLCHVVNPYDLMAVEEAVRLRDLGAKGEVVLVSMGPSPAKEGLRRCFAIGADKGIILWDTAFEGSDSYATALVLAEAIRHLGYDLILCGQRAVDVEAGQVGAILAEFLNIPMISAVVKIDIDSNHNQIIAHRKLQRGNREVVEASLPTLLTVAFGLNRPRYPNLRAVFAAQRKQIKECNLNGLSLDSEQVGVKGSKTKIMVHLSPKPKPKKLFTPDSNLSSGERMRLIMSGGAAQKQGNLLQGNPEHIASNIARFLSERSLLSSKG